MVFLSICTALYDYQPQSDGELAITEGEILYILEKSEEDDWWTAKKKAPSEDEEEPTGLIPNNYVEEAHPTHQAKALYDYSRQTDEELSFSEDALLSVYDTSDPEWTLVGMDGEFGFAPANYIEITGENEPKSPRSPTSPQAAIEDPEPEYTAPASTASAARSGPAAAIAGILHKSTPSTDSQPHLPPRPQQFTPEESDEEAPAPSLPRRPESQQMSPPPTQYASPRSPASPTVAASPPHNRMVSQQYDEDEPRANAGGYHLYNISEMVSVMGKSKKMPTTLGLNLATGKIMIAPEKSRDGPEQEWTAEKLTHYSIEGKHVFIELVRPSKSVDFHAGAKDTAQEIVAALGEIAGAVRAEGLREVLEAAGSGTGQKKGHVLYDFMAQGDDEVTVAVADEVIVLDDTKSDDWWMVRRLKNGKEGVVPSSYVEITGTATAAPSRAGINAAKSTVEQNRLEEERLARESMKSSKTNGSVGSEVGPGHLPTRGSSLTSDNNHASQRSKKDSKSHGRTSSSSKSKPDSAKLRTWTDRSGAFKVEAQFIGLKDGKIHLHKLNGVKIAVPVVKMAVEDLEYVERATGVSLDDEKPLSDIKSRSAAASKKEDRKKSAQSSNVGASVETSKQAKTDGPEYDWFDFFLKAGVSPYQCERYAFNFSKDSMDESILSEINPAVLRNLGLKEGDILRVMKYLDNKFGRTGASSSENATGGLFSGPGGALKTNTSKGRPAPPVQTNDVVDASALRIKTGADSATRDRADSVSSPQSPIPPPPPAKDTNGFEDDAWSVKPSKQSAAPAPAPVPKEAPKPAAPPPPTLTGSLLDLSLLSPPLQPTPAQPTPASQPPAPPQQIQAPSQPPAPPQQQQSMQQPAQLQSQQTGANPAFFSQLNQPPQNPGQYSNQGFSGLSPQQTGPPRQRPQAPPQSYQPGAIMPPPPLRPLSAPQTQPQNSNFGPPPLQPQLTGYHPQGQSINQIAPPGQSLNDLNQQRLQQQQFNQQQQFYQQQPLQQQQTGYQNFNQLNGGIPIQQTGFQAPAFQNPYVIGQQQGSPFADPMGPKPQFQSLQPQQTGFQPQPTGFNPSQFQQQGPLQPMQTGINSSLPPALQPQNTGIANGLSRPGFGQPISQTPPIPPIPSMPTAAPLQPQKTGPAPNIKFGTQPANKLVAQPTGRRANLSAATPSNPFGF